MVKGHMIRVAMYGWGSFVFGTMTFSCEDAIGLLVIENFCREKGRLAARSSAMVFRL